MKAAAFVNRKQSVEEFLTMNEADVHRLAVYILKRWKAPNDVGVEDVKQELRIYLWHYRKKFNAERGSTPEQYLTFNAVSRAKRYVHQQRRARGDKGLGHFELLTSDGVVVDTTAVEPDQEFSLVQRERLALMLDRCTSTREAICLAVFFKERDIRGAARRIYEDDELRRLCDVTTKEDASKAVKRTVEEHAWP